MSTELVQKQDNLSLLTSQPRVPREKPLLEDLGRHPGIAIVVILVAVLARIFLVEAASSVVFADEENWKLFASISITSDRKS